MKTGKVAKVFGVDRKTISNWTDMPQFKNFFSSEALGMNRTQRDYLEPDLLVINTIRILRNRGEDWDEIAATLEIGERERELPISALLVETTAPIAQYGRIVELQTMLEAAEERIDQLKKQVDAVRNEERQRARDREQELLNQIITLSKEISRLEVKLEILQENDAEK